MNINNEPNEINVSFGTEKVYPVLENIEIIPTTEEQHFKSEKYGYDNVTVKKIESDAIIIQPTTDEQTFDGLYNKVIVNKIETEEKVATLDFSNTNTIEITPTNGKYLKKIIINKPTDLVAENIIKDKVIFGVVGENEGEPETTHTELSYIQGTGTQYINTGYTPTNNTAFEICISDVTSVRDTTIMSATSTWSINRILLFIISNQIKWAYRVDTAITTNLTSKHIINLHRNVVTVDGNAVLNDGTNNNVTIDTPLHLFGLKDGTHIGKFKLYYLKIFENNNLAMHLIPCIDKNGLICMYDNVSEKYIYNSGAGAFIAGTK